MAVGEEVVDTGCAYFYFLWGKTAEAENRFEEALEAYEKALVCDPEAESVMRDLAIFYIKLSRYEEAARFVDELQSLHPDDIEIRTLKAELLTGMGRHDEAVAIYKDILSEKPKDIETMLRLGVLYAGTRRFKESRAVLEELVKIDSRSFVGYQYLAKLYWQLGEYDKAIAAYDTLLDIHWMPSLALEAVDLLDYRQKYKKAVSLCRKILEINPDDEQARQRLLRLFLDRGEVKRALDELLALRKRAVNVFNIDMTIGRIYIEQKQFDRAIDHFKEMLAIDPESGNIRYLLALAYGANSEEAKAAELLRQVRPDEPIYEDAVLLLVELLIKEEQINEATGFLSEVIADPVSRRPRFYGVLASVYQRQGLSDYGLRILKEAMKLYPKDARLRYEYSLYLDRDGNFDEALTAMQAALKMDPSNPYALNYIGYTWAERGENLEEARRYIEQAVTLRPDDGFIRDSLGWVYFKLGEDKKAVEELNRALELAADPVILEHLGDVHAKAGRISAALEAYEKALPVFEKEEDLQRLQGKIKALRHGAR